MINIAATVQDWIREEIFKIAKQEDRSASKIIERLLKERLTQIQNEQKRGEL